VTTKVEDRQVGETVAVRPGFGPARTAEKFEGSQSPDFLDAPAIGAEEAWDRFKSHAGADQVVKLQVTGDMPKVEVDARRDEDERMPLLSMPPNPFQSSSEVPGGDAAIVKVPKETVAFVGWYVPQQANRQAFQAIPGDEP